MSFAYNKLVSNMCSFAIVRETGAAVLFHSTLSVRLPRGLGTRSGGQRNFVPVPVRAAAAMDLAGLFMELWWP